MRLSHFEASGTKHALTLLSNLPGQMRKGVTLGKAKSRHRKMCENIDLKLFPEYIAELWDWPETADSNRQFISRLEYFLGLANAHIKWLSENVE